MKRIYVLQSVNNEYLIANHGIFEFRLDALKAARELMMLDNDVIQISINILELCIDENTVASIANSIVLKREDSNESFKE